MATEPNLTDEMVNEAVRGTEAEIFNEALEQEVFDKPLEPKEPTEDEGQPRDETGKFAKAEKLAEEKPADQIPSWRLREEAEARRAAETRADQLERRLSALEPKKPEETPDPLIDPDGYTKKLESRFSERLQDIEREFDLRMARNVHGKTFDDAYVEAQKAIAGGDQGLVVLMHQSRSPGETLVNWFKQRSTLREVGQDPNAWFEKRLTEFATNPEGREKLAQLLNGAAPQQTQQQMRPSVKLPPSLSRATGSSPAQDRDPNENDGSDKAVFDFAMRP